MYRKQKQDSLFVCKIHLGLLTSPETQHGFNPDKFHMVIKAVNSETGFFILILLELIEVNYLQGLYIQDILGVSNRLFNI